MKTRLDEVVTELVLKHDEDLTADDARDKALADLVARVEALEARPRWFRWLRWISGY